MRKFLDVGFGTSSPAGAGGGSGSTPNLQEVTTVGNTTNLSITTAGIVEKTRSVSASYTATATDFFIEVNSTAPGIIITLPALPIGVIYCVKITTYVNSVKIMCAGGTIDNAGDLVLNAMDASVIVINQEYLGTPNYDILASYLVGGTAGNLQAVTTLGNTTTLNIITAGLGEASRVISANYTALVTDFFIAVNLSSSSVTLNLPVFTNAIFAIKIIQVTAGNTLTITVNGGTGTVDVAASLVMNTLNESVILQQRNVTATGNYAIIAAYLLGGGGSTPNLQAVTSVGNTTTNNIITAGLGEAAKRLTSNYTTGINDFLMYTSGTFTITLSNAVPVGTIYCIKKTDNIASAVTIQVQGAGQIDNYASIELVNFSSAVIVMFIENTPQYLYEILAYVPNNFSTGNSASNINLSASGSYSVQLTDATIVNDSGGALAVAISSITTSSFPVGKTLTFTNGAVSGDSITVTPGTGNINGAGSLSISAPFSSVTIQWDGTNWEIISSYLYPAFQIDQIDFEDSGTGIAAQTYTLMLRAGFNFTINDLYIQSGAGTCTVTVQINGTPVTGISGVAVSTTLFTWAATALNTVTVGQKVTMVIAATSGLNNLQASLSYTRS